MSTNNDWPYGAGEDELLKKISSKPGITIEEVFEEEDILTHIRMKNDSFSTFFSAHPELIIKMINYCFNDLPEETLPSTLITKYAFFSSEIFSYELEGLIELFFRNQPAKEESKNEDEVCFGEQSDIRSEDLPDPSKAFSDAGSPIKSPHEGMGLGEEEKKSPDRLMMKKMMEPLSMDEPISMTMKSKLPAKMQYNLESLYLLEFLFSYLEKKKNHLINPTSLGYYSKILNALLNKKFDHMMFYLEKNQFILENCYSYLTQNSISEFVSRIVRLDNPNLLDDYNKHQPLFLPFRMKILKDLTEVFKESENLEEAHNIANIICDTLSKAKRINGSKPLLEDFTKTCLPGYFEKISSTSQSVISKAYSIIEATLKHFLNKGEDFSQLNFVNCSKSVDMNYCMDVLNEEDQKPENINETNIPELLSKFLPRIFAYLREENQNTDLISSTYGTKFSPFGPAKIKMITVLALCYSIEQSSKIGALLSEESIPELLMNFMIKYEWNNVLHQEIHDLIKTIIDGNNIEYKKCLFEKFDILNFIMKFMDMEDYVMPNKHQRKLKRGYLGFLTKVCNNIIKRAQGDPFIKQKIEQNEIFNSFVDNILKKVNSRNNEPLAGFDPRDNTLESSFEYVNEMESNKNNVSEQKNDIPGMERMPQTVSRDSPPKEKYKLCNLKPKYETPTNIFDDTDLKMD